MSETLFDLENLNCLACGRPLDNGACAWCAKLNTNPRKIARRGGPSTSAAAARIVAYRTGTQKALILAEYGKAGVSGLTDEEVAGRLGWVEVNKARKRCSDLRDEGMIVWVDEGVVTRTGKSGIANDVCVITDRGIATLAAMKENDDRRTTADDRPATPNRSGHIHVWVWGRNDALHAFHCRECGATSDGEGS
jgi:hypothetical protein